MFVTPVIKLNQTYQQQNKNKQQEENDSTEYTDYEELDK